MEAALRARLLADGGVSALVQRISWLLRPQGSALPAITLQKFSSDRGYTTVGAGDYQSEGVQADIWAQTFGSGIAIRNAVVDEMERSATASGITFSPSFLDSERQLIEDVAGSSIFRFSLDFSVWWSS